MSRTSSYCMGRGSNNSAGHSRGIKKISEILELVPTGWRIPTPPKLSLWPKRLKIALVHVHLLLLMSKKSERTNVRGKI